MGAETTFSSKPVFQNDNTEVQKFITKIFAWMSFVLFVSGLVARWLFATSGLLDFIVDNRVIFIVLVLANFAFAGCMALASRRGNDQQAMVTLVLHGIMSGITLSSVFVFFANESVAPSLFIAAISFGVMSLYGYVSKRDLTTFGSLMRMLIFGLLVSFWVNVFFLNKEFHYFTTYLLVLIFVPLISHDAWILKELYRIGRGGIEGKRRSAVTVTLLLCINFVFLPLFLQLFIRKMWYVQWFAGGEGVYELFSDL